MNYIPPKQIPKTPPPVNAVLSPLEEALGQREQIKRVKAKYGLPEAPKGQRAPLQWEGDNAS